VFKEGGSQLGIARLCIFISTWIERSDRGLQRFSPLKKKRLSIAPNSWRRPGTG
jgi:hypothetical protein